MCKSLLLGVVVWTILLLSDSVCLNLVFDKPVLEGGGGRRRKEEEGGRRREKGGGRRRKEEEGRKRGAWSR